MRLFPLRQNEVTPEVKTLVDELKSIAPKDRKKVHCLISWTCHAASAVIVYISTALAAQIGLT